MPTMQERFSLCRVFRSPPLDGVSAEVICSAADVLTCEARSRGAENSCGHRTKQIGVAISARAKDRACLCDVSFGWRR
jgi:hypothetical protein